MIITLTGATFTKYIGTLDSYTVFTAVGSGCTPTSATEIVKKNTQYSKTFTLATDYEVGAAGISVTMGGTTLSDVVTQNGSTITITIPSVTGVVYINIPTVNTSTGEEDSGTGGDSLIVTDDGDGNVVITASSGVYITDDGSGNVTITTSDGTSIADDGNGNIIIA